MQGRKRSILLCPVHPTTFSVMLNVAEYMLTDERIDPVFILGSPAMIEKADFLRKRGFTVLCVDIPVSGVGQWLPERIKSIFIKIGQLIDQLTVFNYPVPSFVLKRTNKFWRRLIRYERFLNEKLSKLDPTSLLVGDDRNFIGGFLPAIIKVCRNNSIKVIVLPVSLSDDGQSLVLARRRDRQFLTRQKRFKDCYPGNILKDKRNGQCYTFLPEIITEILYQFGSLPPHPKYIGGGLSDVVLVEGQNAYDRLVLYGCDENKIVITGHPAHDSLHLAHCDRKATRKKLYEKYNLG